MRALLIIVLLLALGVGAALIYMRQQSPDPGAETDIAPTVSPTQPFEKSGAPEPSGETEPEPAMQTAEPVVETDDLLDNEPVAPLPSLGQSDSEALAVAADLVGEDRANRYLVTDALIARTVATIDSLSARQVPGNVMAVQTPPTPFQAEADEWPDSLILNAQGDPIDQYVSSPDNHQRYTPYVEILEAMDVEQALAAYEKFEPLFQDAFAQLGYAEGSFDGRLIEVIDELLATPEVEEPVRFKKPEAFYLFVDEDLEALTAGQKLLIRMGPDNASRVKEKLREFRLALLEGN